MGKKRLSTLCKEINGKQVVYVRNDSHITMNAIMLAPPNGSQVSVKPYGYTPEEVLVILEKNGFEGYNLEKVSAPEFCISSHKTIEERRDELEAMANIPDGGICNLQTFVKQTSGYNPSCPYGA